MKHILKRIKTLRNDCCGKENTEIAETGLFYNTTNQKHRNGRLFAFTETLDGGSESPYVCSGFMEAGLP